MLPCLSFSRALSQTSCGRFTDHSALLELILACIEARYPYINVALIILPITASISLYLQCR